MATAPTYFSDFLSNIRLSDNQVSDLKTGEGYEEKYQISHLARLLAEKLTILWVSVMNFL